MLHIHGHRLGLEGRADLSNGAAQAEQQEVQRHVPVTEAEIYKARPDAGRAEQVRAVVDAAPEVHPCHRVQR